MAHFAQIDENNTVLQVIVVLDEDCKNIQGQECEETGIQFCKSLFGEDTKWKQTSYNTRGGRRYDPKTNLPIEGGTVFRVNYAGIGYTYNEELDAFLPPQPYSSWILNEETYAWEPPIPYPESEELYIWNEENQEWEKTILK
jgi:hypothetical protein